MFEFPSEFEWRTPWIPIDDPTLIEEFGPIFADPDENAAPAPTLAEELHREMPKGHLLYGLKVKAVAFCVADHNEFLFVTNDPNKPIAWVHLTWSVESDRKWPFTCIYRTIAEWVDRMNREHNVYANRSE